MSETEAEEPCLHCELTRVIEQYIEGRLQSGSEVNLADVTDKIVEALAQFIREAVPVEEQAKMIASALEHLGHALLATESEETRH